MRHKWNYYQTFYHKIWFKNDYILLNENEFMHKVKWVKNKNSYGLTLILASHSSFSATPLQTSQDPLNCLP